MKRIYNDIPLASILYGIRGNPRILIRDWESVNAMHSRDTHGKGKYSVAFDDLILETVYEPLMKGESIKRICEQFSYLTA